MVDLSEPGANRGPHAGGPRGVVVATGSQAESVRTPQVSKKVNPGVGAFRAPPLGLEFPQMVFAPTGRNTFNGIPYLQRLNAGLMHLGRWPSLPFFLLTAEF